MVFSSSFFLLVFLPIFFLIYALVAKTYKNIVALVASLFFYAWGAPMFVYLLLVTMLLDFFIAQQMITKFGKEKKILLIISLFVNLGLLAYFKYSNFFVTTIFGENAHWEKVILPIGISFFTFQKISYVLDVYRGSKEPLDKIVDYCLFVLLFPQLIAGPIVRYNDVAEEIKDRTETDEKRILGFFRFTVGLSKKVLIANLLGKEAELIFQTPYSELNSTQAWYGALAYTFQIYFDFSGYSDMAIGLGKMMGFNFPENFNSPYTSKSITEFWQRWHITLGSWMKDYLYIPLGGNRVAKWRLYFNLWLVFLISGLWHGASWNFIIWGAYHGLFLVIERLYLKKYLDRIPAYLSILYTFFLTVLGWVIFKIDDWVKLREYFKVLFSFNFKQIEIENYIVFIFVLSIIIGFGAFNKKLNEFLHQLFNTLENVRNSVAIVFCSILLFISCISGIVGSGFNPFIYFQF